MEKFKHVMLDLETMGNQSNSAIVSIAVVPFNLETGEISSRYFYKKINLQSCLDVGLKVQASTIYWWLNQSEKARNELNDKNSLDIDIALNDLNNFFSFNIYVLGNIDENFEIWGNGARFDIGILEDAYYACGYKELPWKFRNERDVRTLVSLNPIIKEETLHKGTLHNPVDDCMHQIEYCSKIFNSLKRKIYDSTHNA